MIAGLLQKLLGGFFMNKILEMFLTKKRIIGWISAAVFAGGAVAVGMKGDEFKKAVCDAPVIQLEETK